MAFADNCFRKYSYQKEKKTLVFEKQINDHYDDVKNISLSYQRGLIGTACKVNSTYLHRLPKERFILGWYC